MSNRTISLDDTLHDYLLENSLREDPILAKLRAETADMTQGRMQISPEQGQFMALLVRATGVRCYLEVGTFTGYSSISVALALPEDGKAVCCDISEEFTKIARSYWAEAGLKNKMELRLGNATKTLRSLLEEGFESKFDMMFIDADKEGYLDYWESGLKLVRQGGLLLVDNVLWGGRVVDNPPYDSSTKVIRKLNAALKNDSRIDISMLPIGDGLTIARKR